MSDTEILYSTLKAHRISVYEIVAFCSKLNNTSSQLDAQNTELLQVILKAYEKTEKQLETTVRATISVHKELGQRQFENHERALLSMKRLTRLKTAITKVDEDWEMLDKAIGDGDGTSSYADCELTDIEINLEGLECAIRKKRRIVESGKQSTPYVDNQC